MSNVQSQVLPVGTAVVVNDGTPSERRGTVSDVRTEQYLVRFSNGHDEWLLPEVVRPVGGKSIVTAARWFGIMTFLIGGGWWGLLFGDAIVHEPSRGFADMALLTAGLTCVVLIVPTMILTHMSHSRGSGKLWFNRLVLTLVSGMMTWTVVYSAIV